MPLYTYHYYVKTTVRDFNALSANPAKWSNTLKQFVGNLPTNCLSVFDHFMNLAFKGLITKYEKNNFMNSVLNLFNTLQRNAYMQPMKYWKNLCKNSH